MNDKNKNKNRDAIASSILDEEIESMGAPFLKGEQPVQKYTMPAVPGVNGELALSIHIPSSACGRR